MVNGGRNTPRTAAKTYNWLRFQLLEKNWEVHHSTHCVSGVQGGEEHSQPEERKGQIAT